MAADEELGTGSIRIDLDDTGTDASVNRLADRIERILDRATRDAGLRMQRNINAAIRRISPARIRVEADLRAFGHSIDTLNNFDPITLPVDPDVDRARFEAAIEAALAGLTVSVRVVPDLDGFDAAIRAHNAPSVTVDVNADVDRGLSRALSGIGRSLGSLGRLAGVTVGIGALGIASASAAASIGGFIAALAPAAGIIAALPAAIGGGIAAMAAFRLATVGVGDALAAAASGDAEKLADALEKLSPSAREAVSAFAALQPRLKALQQSVQEAFFTRFSGDVEGALKNLLPLQSALGGISAQFGRAASEGLKFAATKDALTPLRGILAGTHAALSGLAPATAPVLKGLLDVAAAVTTAFGQKVGTALRDTLTQFGDFLSVSAASGQAVAWVQGAVDVFRQLGAIASNVGGIISGVFKVANDVGGGLLNNLESITSGMEAFVKSATGQTALANIFATVSAVAAQLVPILGAVVSTLGTIAPALAPLFTTIGPAIAGLIESLGPALANIAPGLQALVSGLASGLAAISDSGAFEALGAAIGTVGTALAPLLPVIGELVGQLVAALAPALTAVASALTPVIQAIAGALMPVIQPLTGVIRTLVTALTPLVTIIGNTLAQVIGAVAPLLSTIARLFAQIATAVAPLITQLADALVPVFATLAPAVSQIVAALVPLITQLVNALLPVLPPIIDAFTAIQAALVPVIPVVASLVAGLAPLVSTLITLLAPIVQFAAEVIKWTSVNVVVPVIQKVIEVLTSFVNIINVVVRIVAGAVRVIVQGFQYLGTAVPAVVSSLVSAVVGFFQSLPGRVLSAVSSVVGTLSSVFTSARNAVLERVSSLVVDAVRLVRELPGKAAAALSGVSSFLVSAGSDLIQGFINGISSAAAGVAKAAVSAAKSAVDGVKGFLGISSPSKVFLQIGKDTGQGFINGLTGSIDGIRQAADRVAKSITDAFKGKNTRLDDVLVARLRATQRELTSLARQRDTIADRIKKANETAVSVAQAALQSFSLSRLAEGGGGVQGLVNGLDAAVTRIKGFTNQINTLAKRGLRDDLLSQIIGLGADQGAGLANSLANASAAQLADLNEAQKQLAAASKKLGQDSADNLFDAGKEASKGFLAGLKAQQQDVEDLMLSLAKGMAAAIRKALGIKSPSKVFRDIGRYTMDGLSVGVDDRLRNVTRSAMDAARAVTEPFGASPGVSVSAGGSGRQTGTQSRGGRAGATITNNFTLQEVGNADATAQRVINRMVLAAGGV